MTIKKIIQNYPIVDVTSNLQDANDTTAAFYYIHKGAEDKFLSRLKTSRPCYLFLNTDLGDIGVPYTVCENFYESQEEVCDLLYDKSDRVKIIGITGTNGKSTCVHLCSSLLNANGAKAFSVGTLGVFSEEKEIFPSPGATTPSYLDLRRITHHLSDYDYMCLEVSSHALKQERIKGFEIDVCGWTNLTQDHLDYHGSMSGYFEAKLMLVKLSQKTFIPVSQTTLIEKVKEKELEVEYSKPRQFDLINPAFKLAYNHENLCLSYDIVKSLLKNDLKVPKDLTLPRGRYTLFEYNSHMFVVDYAHTPDAIEKLTKETKQVLEDYHVITIFGCGGDRDRSKRPLMLDAALKFSDKVIVTSDNPRTEDPQSIVSDALNGRAFSNVETIVNRKEAIERSVKDYENKTIVLIAGKGHEEYQEVNGVKNFFSDIELIRECLESIK